MDILTLKFCLGILPTLILMAVTIIGAWYAFCWYIPTNGDDFLMEEGFKKWRWVIFANFIFLLIAWSLAGVAYLDYIEKTAK